MVIGVLYNSKYLLDVYIVIMYWVYRDGLDLVGRN